MNDTEQQRPTPPQGQPQEQPPQEQPAQEPSAQEPPAQEPPAQEPPAQPPPPAGWGAPPPPADRPRWSVRRTVIAVAVALGIAAAGGVAIYAASGSTADQQAGPGGGPGGMRMNGPVVGGPLGESDHGEFQNGEVTELSDTSITVESDDGYTRTYVIDSDTVRADDVEKGDDVTVVATTSEDDEATATMIGEQGQGMMAPRRDGQDGDGGPPRGGGN